jgi:nitroreductase
MKKIALISILVLGGLSLNAQNIQLPKPQTDGGENILKTLSIRQSDRSFKEGDISMEDLSTMLWAGFGYVRDGKRTAPSAMNRQDIDLYVFLSKGVYLWNAKENVLVLVKEGDFRPLTDREGGFAGKVTNIAIVSNLEKFDIQKDHHNASILSAMSAAYVSENMYLAADGLNKGLGTVTRYAARQEKQVAELLNLSKFQRIYLFQTIGYKK